MGIIFVALLLVGIVLLGIVLSLAGFKRWNMATEIIGVWSAQEAAMDLWFDQAVEIHEAMKQFDRDSDEARQWDIDQLEVLWSRVRDFVGGLAQVEHGFLDDLSARDLRTYREMVSTLPKSARRDELKKLQETQG